MNKLLRALLAPYLMFAVDDDTSKTTVETDPETGETVGTGNDDRVARLNAIANANDETREEELADINDDGSTAPFRAKEEPGEGDTTAESAEEPKVEEPTPTDSTPPEPKKYTLKVNGKTIEVTEEELIARAQKVEAADDYLRYAKTKARTAAVVEDPSPEPPAVDYAALARAIQMGTEEEAVKALQTLEHQAKSRPSVTPDDVFRTVDERLEFKTAWNTFKSEYSEIVNDPILKNMAQQMDDELLAEGDDRPYLERYRAIGESLTNWLKSKAPAPAAAPAPAPSAAATLQQKAERKASTPSVPAPASAKAAQQRQEEEEVDDNPSSIIANMARHRGGPQWMRN